MSTHRRTLILGFASAAALAACSPPNANKAPPADAPSEAPPVIPDPADVIRPLYQRYMTPAAATTFPTLEEQAPWSDDLRAKLVAMMARSAARNEPILDFDPFTGAQDWQLSNLTVITEALVENSHAAVRARFTNFAEPPHEIVYDMVWQGDAWRVDNIRGEDYDRGQQWDLRQIVTQ
jgi:hypothetical protein